MAHKKLNTVVAYARCTSADTSVPIYPKERYDEIKTAKNERVRCEKYLVWKLLRKTVTEHLNLNFNNLQFTKTDNGQWICPDFYFSLTHTDGLVCVAVSNLPIGVDAERVHPINSRLADRILTDRERTEFLRADVSERDKYLLDLWVRKESIFKKSGGKAMIPSRIETDGYTVVLKRIALCRTEYLISVCTDGDDMIEFKFMEDI